MLKKILSTLLIGLLTSGTVIAAPTYCDNCNFSDYEQDYNGVKKGNTNNQPTYNYHPDGQESPSAPNNPLLAFGFFAIFAALLSKGLAI